MRDEGTPPRHTGFIVVNLAVLSLLLGIIVALAMSPIFAVGTPSPPFAPEGPGVELLTDPQREEHGLGMVPSDLAKLHLVRVPAQMPSVRELPSKVDLSQSPAAIGELSEDGIPPVGDQGETNTCVGWATSYYYKTYQEWLEHGWEVENGGPNYDHVFSVNFVYNQITDHDVGCDDGAQIGDALDKIVTEGDAPWSVMPWHIYYCDTQPEPWQKVAALEYTGIDYAAFFITTGPPSGPEQNHDLTPLKQWVANEEPFILGFPVYSEFDNAGCHVPVMPPANPGTFRGLHAATVIGYDDYFGGEGAFKIINSWGAYWGCEGYAWLSYEFVQKYAWEAWWMRKNYTPWIAPEVPIRYSPELGALIEMDLTPHENDREDSGPDLKWYVEGADHCTVLGEGSADDVLRFQPNPSSYTGYDEITLRLEDSEGGQDTQQVTLGWFDLSILNHLPLGLGNHPD